MEEEKAAAYYDELTRKGEGAARFKQGLGFSSASSQPFPAKQTPSSYTLFSNFVRASSPSKAAALDKQAQLEKIHNKLKKPSRRCRSRSPSPSDRDPRRRQSRERDDRYSHERRRRRSTSRERRRDSGSHSMRHHRREREEDLYSRSSRRKSSSRSKSRSRSPIKESRSRDRNGMGGGERGTRSERHKSSGSNSGVDYSKLIKGYSEMTPAERVKAKMKFQLSETAAKDMTKGSGWERFDFNKDAPLDDDNDDDVEVADDDASVVKNIGKSFRLSAVEANREQQIKAAHDEAMFGVSAPSEVLGTDWSEVNSTEDSTRNNDTDEGTEKKMTEILVSDKVIAMQQTSWRERARRPRNDLKS